MLDFSKAFELAIHKASLEIPEVELCLQLLPRLKKISFIHRVDFKAIMRGPEEALSEIASQVDPQNVSVYAKLLSTVASFWRQASSHEGPTLSYFLSSNFLS